MDNNDFFAATPAAPAPVSRFDAPSSPFGAPPPLATHAATHAAPTRWRATSTTFGPWVKVPLTVLVLLLALWSPVHHLLAAPAPAPAASSSGTPFEKQVANAVGGGLLPSKTTQAVVQKTSALVSGGAHAFGNAVSAWTWTWHLLIAAVVLFFLWQPGRRVRRG